MNENYNSYTKAMQAQDEIVAFLRSQSIYDVGVGLSVERPAKVWVITVNTARPLSKNIQEQMTERSNGIEVQINNTGPVLAY